ncbi:Importin alpha subunit (Karyopherin alpha subunit) (Serine-rich RNA polymerase I suppressor protein) [Nowakowskiella sp. JEL0078]|nr:Importin alpha subunit (Karyopherin alpha subunit) (Serine-rich RNA polymerase I suppressor protein) [Nowakowskiella sp. JEL0078]
MLPLDKMLNKSDFLYLVNAGCIKPLCDFLEQDTKIVQVALDGLDNILKIGESEKEQTNNINEMANQIKCVED